MSSTNAHGSALRSVRTGLATLAAATLLSLTSLGAGAQEKGGSMTYLSSNIPGLNPLHSAFEVGLVSSQIFASLVRLGEDNRPIPYLAESFSVSEDGLAYTFNLAKNATFHDGKPVTSADVAFSLGGGQGAAPFRAADVRSGGDGGDTRRPHRHLPPLEAPRPAAGGRDDAAPASDHAQARLR